MDYDELTETLLNAVGTAYSEGFMSPAELAEAQRFILFLDTTDVQQTWDEDNA